MDKIIAYLKTGTNTRAVKQKRRTAKFGGGKNDGKKQ